MDKGLRVVGFTFSNHGESTLNAEVSNAKLQTQRSLLSELLAVHAVGSGGLSSDSENGDSSDEDDDAVYDSGTVEPAPVQVETFRRSSPITIPCPESLANERAKDAYRRLVYQRQVEQLHYQQQQRLQLQYQQQLWIQHHQRRLQLLQQQQQTAAQKHQAGLGDGVGAQSRGQTATVPVY